MFRPINKLIKSLRTIVGESLFGIHGGKPGRQSMNGQIAIILLVITAIALIFFAVVLNISRSSQIKTATQIAATLATSQMGSLMASYGESIFQTTLGGRRKICGFTGVFAAIIAFVLIIVIIVLAFFTVGTSLLASPIVVALTIVLAIAAIVLQMTVVQPGISKLWNKMAAAALTPADSFIEQGVRTGLQSAISDQGEVLDYFDIDLDGEYVGAPLGWSTEPGQRMGRFAYYYTQRLKRIELSDTEPIEDFLDALRALVYVDNTPGDFGLYDPVQCTGSPADSPCCNDSPDVPSICNVCCVPPYQVEVWDDDNSAWTLVWVYPTIPGTTTNPPETCCNTGNPATECGVTGSCAALSPYLGFNPWIFETHFDDVTNSWGATPRLSWREMLGRDDEHRAGRKSSIGGLTQSLETVPPVLAPPVGVGPFYSGYRMEDTTGYHSPPPPHEYQFGIFEVLHKFHDWGIDLELAQSRANPYQTKAECHWTDENFPLLVPPFIAGVDCNNLPTTGRPAPEWPGAAVLPQFNSLGFVATVRMTQPIVDGLNDCDTLLAQDCTYPNPNCCNQAGALRVDMIGNVVQNVGANNYSMIGPEIECAGQLNNIGDPIDNLWKKGADKFCSAEPPPLPGTFGLTVLASGWPYSSRCTKHATPFQPAAPPGQWRPGAGCLDSPTLPSPTPDDCDCAQAVARDPYYGWLWETDTLDDVAYGLTDFIAWADGLLQNSNLELINSVQTWYPEAAQWIEQAGNITNLPDDGGLWKWLWELQNWEARVGDWVDRDWEAEDWDADDSGPNGVNGAFCYPPRPPAASPPAPSPPPAPPYMPREERIVINSTLLQANPPPPALPINKSADAVIACLDWNANDAVELAADPGQTGNGWKFLYCGRDPLQCGFHAHECAVLPRSLLPTNVFDQTQVFIRPILQDFLTCYGGDPNNLLLGGCGGEVVNPGPPVPSSPVSDQGCQNILDFVFGPGVVTPDYALCPASLVVTAASTMPFCCSTWTAPILPVVGADCVAAYPNNAIQQALCALIQIEVDPIAGPSRSCVDAAFLTNSFNSAVEAVNQVEKFRKRLAVLDGPNGVVDQMKHFEQNVLSPITQELSTFLLGPAEGLRNAIVTMNTLEAAISRMAIYGWQSEPSENQTRGPWHIVRVDVRLPRRCSNACGSGGATDPAWPWVRTYTKRWSTRRCYELTDDRGMVKSRVTRWDEDTTNSPMLKFPGGYNLWRFRFSHPLAATTTQAEIDEMLNRCTNENVYNPLENPEGLPPNGGFEGAFLFDQRLEPNDPIHNRHLYTPDCFNATNALLEKGVTSEACAEYYFHGGSRPGFNIKFVPCQNFL